MFYFKLEEAKLLVRNAIAAGILNDLGSGNSCDLYVISKDGSQYLRNYEHVQKSAPR